MNPAAGARGELQDFQSLFARAMIFVDAPDHARLRGVMNAGFRGDALERLRPFIETWIDARLDALEARCERDPAAPFDFIAEIARPLPAQVIATLMGIGSDDRAEFINWSDDLAEFIGSPQPTLDLARRAQRGLKAMAAYFEKLAAQRRQDPGDPGAPGDPSALGDTLLSRLLQAEAAGLIQPGAELLAQCAMLLFAGHETTRNLLGNGLHALLSQPGQWQRLCDEPQLLPGAVRELLRFDSPVQYTGRRVARDHVLHGQALKRGELVVALIGAANRDPARYERPDELDLGRASGASLSFGAGPHVCIGAALTLMEAQLLFSRLTARWPGLHLVEAPTAWSQNPVYRGLERLAVRIRPPHSHAIGMPLR